MLKVHLCRKICWYLCLLIKIISLWFYVVLPFIFRVCAFEIREMFFYKHNWYVKKNMLKSRLPLKKNDNFTAKYFDNSTD